MEFLMKIHKKYILSGILTIATLGLHTISFADQIDLRSNIVYGNQSNLKLIEQ
jgi:hypothetical protein